MISFQILQMDPDAAKWLGFAKQQCKRIMDNGTQDFYREWTLEGSTIKAKSYGGVVKLWLVAGGVFVFGYQQDPATLLFSVRRWGIGADKKLGEDAVGFQIQYYGGVVAVSVDGGVAAWVQSSSAELPLEVYRWTHATGTVQISDNTAGILPYIMRGATDGGAYIWVGGPYVNTVISRWSKLSGVTTVTDSARTNYSYIETATDCNSISWLQYDDESFRWSIHYCAIAVSDDVEVPTTTQIGDSFDLIYQKMSADGSVVVFVESEYVDVELTIEFKVRRWSAVLGVTETIGVTGTSNPVGVPHVSEDGSVAVWAQRESGFWKVYRWDATTGPVQISSTSAYIQEIYSAKSGEGATLWVQRTATLTYDLYRWAPATGAVRLNTESSISILSVDTSSDDGVVVWTQNISPGVFGVHRWSALHGLVLVSTQATLTNPAMTDDGNSVAWQERDPDTTLRKGFRCDATIVDGVETFLTMELGGVGGDMIPYFFTPDKSYLVGTSDNRATVWRRKSSMPIPLSGVRSVPSRGY